MWDEAETFPLLSQVTYNTGNTSHQCYKWSDLPEPDKRHVVSKSDRRIRSESDESFLVKRA